MKKISILITTVICAAFLLIAFSGCSIGPSSPNTLISVTASSNPISFANSTTPTLTFAQQLQTGTATNNYYLYSVSLNCTLPNGTNVLNAINPSPGQPVPTTTAYNMIGLNTWLPLILNYFTENPSQSILNATYTFTYKDNNGQTVSYPIQIMCSTSVAPSSSFQIQSARYISGSSALTNQLVITFSQSPQMSYGSSTIWQNISTAFVISPSGLNIVANPGINNVTISGMTMTISDITGYIPATFTINAPYNPNGQSPTIVYSINSQTGALSYLQQSSSAISF